jgi:hypothetical protein
LPWARPIYFSFFSYFPGPAHRPFSCTRPSSHSRRSPTPVLLNPTPPPSGPHPPASLHATWQQLTPFNSGPPSSPLPLFLLGRAKSHRHGRARFLSIWLRPGRTSLVPCSNGESSACAAAELNHVEPLPPASPRRDERRCALPPGAILAVLPADAYAELASATSVSRAAAPPEMPPFPPPSASWNAITSPLLHRHHVAPLLG